MWNEENINGERKLISYEGGNQAGEIHLTGLDIQADFDSWCENGYEAVEYEGEIYVKFLIGETDYEVLTLQEFNSKSR